MTWIKHRLTGICAVALLGAGCGSDDAAEDGGAVDSTGPEVTTSDTDASTTDDSASDSGSGSDSGSDSGSGSDAGSESGDPPEQCPTADDAVSAAFSISIDGVALVPHYSEFSGGIEGLPDGWGGRDAPQLDGECDVVEQTETSLSVTCIDFEKVERTFTVEAMGSELFGVNAGDGPVQVRYMASEAGDMLEHLPDTAAHGFLVSNDDGIVLAGVEGRYSIDSSLGDAWPEVLVGQVSEHPCAGLRGEAHFELEDGTTLDLFDGATGDLGPYRVLVETAIVTSEFDGEFDQTVPIVHWLLGRP